MTRRFSKTHSVVLGFVVGALLSGCMIRRQAHSSGSTVTGSEAFTRVRATLNLRCASCHEDYLDSRVTPESLALKVMAGHPESSELVLALRGAKEYVAGVTTDGTMPAGGDALSRQFFDDLILWINELAKSPSATPTPGMDDPTPTPVPGGNPNPNCNFNYVRSLFYSKCNTCHLDYFTKDATVKSWLDYGIIDGTSTTDFSKDTIYCRLKGADTSCADGKNKDMPKTSSLSAQQVADVKCYVGTVTGTSGGSGGSEGAARTAAVVSIIDSKCASCHNVDVPVKTGPRAGNTVLAFSNCDTDSCFLAKNLLMKGNYSSSWIGQSIEGAGGVDRMPPPPASALSTSEKQSFTDWINKMQ